MKHGYIQTNGVRLHVVQAGPESGPLVILLHGFPEFWYGWRHQIDALAAAGFRVWAPDQRGYNDSDKPVGIQAYTIDTLAADILGLIDAAGEERAFLVGHDWGAVVAWWIAAAYPQRLGRLVIINVPHPEVMARFIVRRPRQLLKSWYIGFFQLPWLPEWLAGAGNGWFLTQTLRRTSRPNTFTADDLNHYRAAWAKPGPTGDPALRTMINWYRARPFVAGLRSAGLTGQSNLIVTQRISIPTLIIWGVADAFLLRDLAERSLEQCGQGQLIFIEQGTHWVHHEAADAVNSRLIAFLQSLPAHDLPLFSE